MGRKVAIAFLSLPLLPAWPAGGGKPLLGRKVLMVIAPQDFRDEEYRVPREALESAGAKVFVASTKVGIAVGMLGLRVKVDLPLSKVSAKEFDAIIFVGGSGSKVFWNDREALRLAREAAKEGKVLAAICLAPVTLANAGVLKGREATVWRSPDGETVRMLESRGAIYVNKPVVKSGNIITANGPQAAGPFAQEILKALVARGKGKK